MIKIKTVRDLPFGIIDTLESQSIPRGACSKSLNFQSRGDRIALRPGYKLYGNEVEGTGKITGHYTAKIGSTEIQYRTHGKKLEYYVSATDTWTEIGSDILGEDADGKDMSFAEYHPVAGDYLYINSPYGPFLKIDLADPGTATDVYVAYAGDTSVAHNHYGYIRIKQNRMFLWGRTGDPFGVYLSQINNPALSLDIEDFSFSATRVVGEGAIFRQDDGGPIMSIESYGDAEYCIHEKKTWLLTTTADDTDATNVIYRDRVGIPYWKACVSTADGIYYIDDIDKSDPQIRLLTIPYGMDRVMPTSISKGRRWKNTDVGIDLSDYTFDKAIGKEYGDLILFACRTSDSSQNNRMIVFNKRQKTFDLVNYWASTLEIFDGKLMGGDPVSGNIQQFYTDYDDNGSNIENYWEGNKDDLDWAGKKKLKKLIIKGRIAASQELTVSVKLDNDADFVEMGTISGADADASTDVVLIGRGIVGRTEIGGEGSDNDANSFVSEINVASLLDKFNYITIRFEAEELGACEVSEWSYYDFRIKSHSQN